MTDIELTHHIIGTAIDVHRELGPGLLENVYEESLCYELSSRGIAFEKQKPIPVVYKGAKLDCGYRADIVVCGRVIVEIKAISAVAPIHDAVMLTYLRLSGTRIGLLINFHSALLKDGIHLCLEIRCSIGGRKLNAETQRTQRQNGGKEDTGFDREAGVGRT